MEENIAPEATRNPSQLFDSISTLPDEILHHILAFVPTKLAIRTSILSKRWRHVWRETPHLSFSRLRAPTESILETLASYSAAKLTRFHLHVDDKTCLPYFTNHHVRSLIEFAISRHVEMLSVILDTYYYVFNDFFFDIPSLKQLTVRSNLGHMIPKCTVSWTSLQNLSLIHCVFSDESFPMILSGCPLLESLTLKYSGFLACLDLSESLRLRRLDVEFTRRAPEKLHIVAPSIHYLRLMEFMSECTLSDVPSLVEANVETPCFLPRFWCIERALSKDPDDPLKDVYHVMVQAMLEKLENVENLTLGLSFLQMLSISKFRGVPFPTFKVRTLTLKTTILPSVVPGIAKLLQSSPGLNKLIFIHKTEDWDTTVENCVNSYLNSQDMILPASSSLLEVAKLDVVTSFIELLLGNAGTLETLVVRLNSCLDKASFDELSLIALILSHKYKVSIVLT